MKFRSIFGVSAVAVGLASCTMLPQASRTSTVHDIKIEMELGPETLAVAPGDEVRWVNLRKSWVLVQIPNLNVDDLICQDGFTNWLGQIKESIKVKPDRTASLCFKKPAVVLYNVRADTALPGGKRVLSGSVKVGKLPE
jgi:plastocyanin